VAITVKVGELVAAVPALQKVSQINALPMKQLYDCAKLLKRTQPELEAFNETRGKLVEQFGEHDEEAKGTVVKPDTPGMEKFVEKYAELCASEITLETSKLDLSAIPDSVVTGLNPGDLMLLEPFCEIRSGEKTA